MKSVLISISPWWCELIALRYKILELRKNRPSLSLPFMCYIYQTKGQWRCAALRKLGNAFGLVSFLELAERLEGAHGKVIGEFICDDIITLHTFCISKRFENESCLSAAEIRKYAKGSPKVFGWHISNLKIYDVAKELHEFYRPGTLSSDDFEYQKYDGSGVPSRNSYESYLRTQSVRRPPQSWCYVEGQKGGKDIWR